MNEIEVRTVAATGASRRKVCGRYGTCPGSGRREIVTAALVLADRAESNNIAIRPDAVVSLHAELD